MFKFIYNIKQDILGVISIDWLISIGFGFNYDDADTDDDDKSRTPIWLMASWLNRSDLHVHKICTWWMDSHPDSNAFSPDPQNISGRYNSPIDLYAFVSHSIRSLELHAMFWVSGKSHEPETLYSLRCLGVYDGIGE